MNFTKNTKLIDHIAENPDNYLITNLSDLSTEYDRKLFYCMSELTKGIAIAKRANALYEAAGSKKMINIQTLLNALDAVIFNKRLTEEQELQYFNMVLSISELSSSLTDFQDLNYVVPLEVDFHIKGWPLEEQVKNPIDENMTGLVEEYLNLFKVGNSADYISHMAIDLLAKNVPYFRANHFKRAANI